MKQTQNNVIRSLCDPNPITLKYIPQANSILDCINLMSPSLRYQRQYTVMATFSLGPQHYSCQAMLLLLDHGSSGDAEAFHGGGGSSIYTTLQCRQWQQDSAERTRHHPNEADSPCVRLISSDSA